MHIHDDIINLQKNKIEIPNLILKKAKKTEKPSQEKKREKIKWRKIRKDFKNRGKIKYSIKLKSMR